MIYPLVHNTITQYRGPRFDSELAKFFNSVVFDTNKAYTETELQAIQINQIMTMHINGSSVTSINASTSLDMQEVGASAVSPSQFQSYNKITSRLDNLDAKITQLVLSIY